MTSREEEMICTCDVDGIRAVEALRIDALRGLGLARPEDLMLAVVLSLGFDFSADATVDADQWFRVTVTTPLKPDGLFVECDHPGDGMVYLWTELAAEFPERVTTADAGTAADVLAATEASAALVKAHRSVNEIRDATAIAWGSCVLFCSIDWGSSVLGALMDDLHPELRKGAGGRR